MLVNNDIRNTPEIGNTMARKSTRKLLEELEEQFHGVQKKMLKIKDNYLASHQKEYDKARASYRSQKQKLEQASSKATREAEKFRKSGTKTAQNQLKKARAAAVVLAEALGEASRIMNTAQDQLKSARPFEKKLAARAKALAAFEKEWEKTQIAAEKAKAERAKKRKAAAKKKTKT